MNSELIELINKIYEMEGVSLSEKIIEYCDVYDRDVQEIGDILGESEDFRRVMLNDCIKNNIIKEDMLKTIIERTETISVW